MPAADTNAPFEFSIKTDLRPDPGNRDYARHYAEVLEEVRLADELGYRSVWTTEQHATDDGYLPAQFPALAAFAAVTTRLRLGTGVLILPYYKVRQVLESAVVVDAFSQGRLQLGIGVGQYPLEFELFGVEMRRRGRLVEEGINLLRQGFLEGALADGPNGQLVPLTPRPVQDRIPLIVGGWAEAAIDRAVRLGDGYIGSDSAHPEINVPEQYRSSLLPALDRHGRSLGDFRFVLGAPLWVSHDPEKDWHEHFGPAFRYQQHKYVEAADAHLGGASLDFHMDRVLIGTPDDLARRLLAMWSDAPFHELGFYYRLPGVSHERAMEQIELVSSKLVPALGAELSASRATG